MIKTVVYLITYRRSKDEPKVTETRNTAEAAYKLALDIETNGGITLVTPIEKYVAEAGKPKLTFED